jgi:dihydroxyacetone kinase-like protein
MLSDLDGQIGDGDLGITLLKAFRELDRIAGTLDDDLGKAFAAMAGAVSRVSSSSFGTLLATALMTAARATRGETAADWSRLPGVLDAAREAMSARGKAALGDKTVLDALDAAANALRGAADPAAMPRAAVDAITATLDSFRDRPARVGRARIFGDRTIGLDDPGMVALREMAGALAGDA